MTPGVSCVKREPDIENHGLFDLASLSDRFITSANFRIKKQREPLMVRNFFVIASILGGLITPVALAQTGNLPPVTQEMLLNPSPDDWLMPSRTYDWQRFSPLSQINKQNVGQLSLAWA